MPTVLVTGANRGLGLEFVRQYAADGWTVIACCRFPGKAEALNALERENPAVRVEPLDVADPASLAVLQARLSGFAIDVLINNAGILGTHEGEHARSSNISQQFGSLDAEEWLQVLRINAITPVMVTEALIGNLRLGHDKKVVMMSSVVASIAMIQKNTSIAYRSSKAALNAAMKVVANTLQPDGIVVISMHPGWARTDMGGPQADIAPEEGVRGVRRVIAGLTMEQSGRFFSYDGSELPW